jgi:hypothetical protein
MKKIVDELAGMAQAGELEFSVQSLEQSVVFEVVRVRRQKNGKAGLLVAVASYDQTEIDWIVRQQTLSQAVRDALVQEFPVWAEYLGEIDFLLRTPPPQVRTFEAADPAKEIITFLKATGMTPVDALGVLSEVNAYVVRSVADCLDEGGDDDDGGDDGPRPPERRRPFRAGGGLPDGAHGLGR